MPMKLGMLGMWHTHADGIVRQVAAHPEEFTLVGFYDPDPQVVRSRRQRWEPMVPGMRVFDSAEACCASRSTASSSRAGSTRTCSWRAWRWRAAGR